MNLGALHEKDSFLATSPQQFHAISGRYLHGRDMVLGHHLNQDSEQHLEHPTIAIHDCGNRPYEAMHCQMYTVAGARRRQLINACCSEYSMTALCTQHGLFTEGV
jgi:hypothetical protein